jgi:hypothetical protein
MLPHLVSWTSGGVQVRIAYRIVLCGQSIFLHTIEAALTENPAIEVLRLHPNLPSIVERIVAWQPDIVLVERKPKHSELVLALLGLGLPLVELDIGKKQAVALTGRQVAVVGVSDLLQVIEQVAPSERIAPSK